MNRIRIRIRRLVGVAGGLACAWLGLAVAAPAAFAMRYPQPQPVVPPHPGPAGFLQPYAPPPSGELSRFEPVAHHFNGATGGMTGWQIALIALGAAILGAIGAVLVERARATRRHRPATAH